MGAGRKDAVHVISGIVGVVPYGLTSGYRLPSVTERLRPRTPTKLRPLHDLGVHLRHCPEGTLLLLRAAPEVPPSPTADKKVGGPLV